MAKHRPPVTNGQRWFWFAWGVLGIALVAALMEYVVDPPAESQCVPEHQAREFGARCVTREAGQ